MRSSKRGLSRRRPRMARRWSSHGCDSGARYARSEQGNIAYQVTGEGPTDVVLVGDWWNHIEWQWEEPRYARFLARLASFSRLIVFDKRGTGLSDPVALDELPTLERWMDDVRVVIDAAGAEQVAVVAHGAGGPMAMLFPATYPERVSGLVLISTFATLARHGDYPVGLPPSMADTAREWLTSSWGTGAALDTLGPSGAADSGLRDWLARFQRLTASPGAAAAMMNWTLRIDVRDVLGAVRVPTLILLRTDEEFVRPDHGRYLAERIPSARLVELPGRDYLYFVGDSDAVLAEIQEFLTGVREAPEPDRVLATVMFTDIVGSTEKAAAFGDRAWRDMVQRHHAAVRRQLDRVRGREVDTAGDGFFATFDGPARAIRCAEAIREAVEALGIEVRIGLHTGECELLDDKVSGIAVNTGARVASCAGPSEIFASRTVVDLVAGAGIEFFDRGMHTLKGVPGQWQLFSVAT
jgi:pimeloyl-ACP methyl ester carboxylesterase